MMTIVTHVHLKEGVGRELDAAMRTRLSAAKKRPGWVGGQLLRQSEARPASDRRHVEDARGLGGLAPRPAIRSDARAARRVRERSSRALVA